MTNEKISLNKPSAPCSEDPNYSFTSCIFMFIARSVGCQIDWLGSGLTEKIPKCLSKNDILAYDAKLRLVGAISWFDLSKITGCRTSCKVRHFSLTNCKSEKVTWKRDWSSAFYLAARKTEVRKEEEFWVFDISDTINGIGGAMGLFLGWSVLYLIHQFAIGVKTFYTYFVSKRM